MIYTFKNFLVQIVSTIVLISLLTCQQEQKCKKDILARVGEREITTEEFRLFYELDPNFGIDSTGLDALKDQINKYIDRYLSLEKAELEGLWNDSVYRKALNWEKKQAKLRQLYRDIIEKSVRITEDEIRIEYVKQTVQVNVRHLFSKNQEQIQEWYRQLKQERTFEDIAQEAFYDSALANNGGNLGWSLLSDFDLTLANQISVMEVNNISKPVLSRWGYHIIQLLDRRDQVIIDEYNFNQKKESIRKKLNQKKSRENSVEYIKNYIGEINPQLNPSTFRYLLYCLVSPAEREKKTYSFKITITDFLVNKAETELVHYLENPLIEYYGGQISLADYLLALQDIPLGNRPRFNSARQFSNQIGIWIRDELLIKKADEHNLETNRTILREISDFQAEHSYYHYITIEKENLIVPESIKLYFLSKDRRKLAAEHRKFSHFHGLEEWRWWQAEKRVHKKLRLDNSPIWINYKKLENENNTIDWNNRIRMFMLRNPS